MTFFLIIILFFLQNDDLTSHTLSDSVKTIPDKETLIQLCITQLHRGAIDSIIANSSTICKYYPEDPAGYLIAADAYQSMMRAYRVRRFEAQFDSLIDISVNLARNVLKHHPSAENYFMLGVAEGYSSVHRFRRREWVKAIGAAVTSMRSFKIALRLKAEFVDPLLGLALYEYGKSKILDMGLGLFTHNRKKIIKMLEKVQHEGRYMSINAMFSLQFVHFEAADFVKALELNDQLYHRFPQDPGCLYNRALLLENLNYFPKAVPIWKKLITRIEKFVQPSNGYLAECHYHLSNIYYQLNEPDKAKEELELAYMFANRYDNKLEIDGPYTSFKEIKKAIESSIRNL